MLGVILVGAPIVIIFLCIVFFKYQADKEGSRTNWFAIFLFSIPVILFFGFLSLVFFYGISDNKDPYGNYPSIYDNSF